MNATPTDEISFSYEITRKDFKSLIAAQPEFPGGANPKILMLFRLPNTQLLESEQFVQGV
jgi:hypothetical protein